MAKKKYAKPEMSVIPLNDAWAGRRGGCYSGANVGVFNPPTVGKCTNGDWPTTDGWCSSGSGTGPNACITGGGV